MNRRHFLAALAATTPALALAGPAAAREPRIYTGRFSDLALQGHDPVAYFTEGRPVKGERAFQTQREGATWRFASQNNLDAFSADPARYAPQYGGYCAWAVAEGKLAKGDARFWAMVDGKLYLNFNQDIQDLWDTDRPGFIRRADTNWPSILV